VPPPTVARLPLYHRVLAELAARGTPSVSSSELASVVGVNAATLRRDLSRLGTFGVRGSGYEVATLLAAVGRALAVDRDWPVAIVGAGNLGRALARSQGFSSGGFRVAVVLDVDPVLVGTDLGGCLVAHLDALEALVAREDIAIGVVTTPASSAQDVADRLVAAGVRSLLNFAPAIVEVPPGVWLRNVDLSAELEVLAFYGARGAAAEAVLGASPLRAPSTSASS
jgi:redox-sensing transcriptional repressor